MTYFDIIRLAALIAVIGYAAWQDHTVTIKFEHNGKMVEGGEVRNKTWLYAPFGLCLTFIAIYLNPETALMSFLSMGATIVLVLILDRVGGMGGADGKAFLTIAASMPLTPFNIQLPIMMYPLAVILVSALLSFGVSSIKQKNVPMRDRHVRFLPYVFVSLFIALLI
jgi:Flp pilus assembly protein protease CpaA